MGGAYSSFLDWKKGESAEVQRAIEAVGRYLIVSIASNRNAGSIMHSFLRSVLYSPYGSKEAMLYLAVLEARQQAKPGSGSEKTEAVLKQIEDKCLEDRSTLYLYQQMMRRTALYYEMLSKIMQTQGQAMRRMAQNFR